MKVKVRIILLLIIITNLIMAQSGRQSIIEIPSPSLTNAIIDQYETRKISVYLPPSYDTTTINYPVVYFLPGFGDNVDRYNNWIFTQQNLNNLFLTGNLNEMIIVIADGYNSLDGSFYQNSPVTGNWKDFITKDVVNYIDENYRTLNQRQSRAICGHSMGGYGALNIGIIDAEIFGIIYSLSPGVFDENGLKDQGMFSIQNKIRTFLQKRENWKTLEKEEAKTAYLAYAKSQLHSSNWLTGFTYSYGATFSPDPDGYPPYIKYPYTISNDSLICDSTLIINFENGFGGISEKLDKYEDNLNSLIDLSIDCGTKDYFSWIIRGCYYFSDKLKEKKISHELFMHNGDHESKLQERIIKYMLPRFSEKLKFDPSITDIKNDKTIPNKIELKQNYPNPFNPTTKIEFSIPRLKTCPDASLHTLLSVFDILGNKITTLVEESKRPGTYTVQFDGSNLTSGVYFYRLKAGSFSGTKKLILLK